MSKFFKISRNNICPCLFFFLKSLRFTFRNLILSKTIALHTKFSSMQNFNFHFICCCILFVVIVCLLHLYRFNKNFYNAFSFQTFHFVSFQHLSFHLSFLFQEFFLFCIISTFGFVSFQHLPFHLSSVSFQQHFYICIFSTFTDFLFHFNIYCLRIFSTLLIFFISTIIIYILFYYSIISFVCFTVLEIEFCAFCYVKIGFIEPKSFDYIEN